MAKGLDSKFLHYGIHSCSHSKNQTITPLPAIILKHRIKGQMAFALGMGKKYKKINVTHLV